MQAICPARGVGAALTLPYIGTEAMQMHLDEISTRVAYASAEGRLAGCGGGMKV